MRECFSNLHKKGLNSPFWEEVASSRACSYFFAYIWLTFSNHICLPPRPRVFSLPTCYYDTFPSPIAPYSCFSFEREFSVLKNKSQYKPGHLARHLTNLHWKLLFYPVDPQTLSELWFISSRSTNLHFNYWQIISFFQCLRKARIRTFPCFMKFSKIYTRKSYKELSSTTGSNNNNHNGAKMSLCPKLWYFFFSLKISLLKWKGK